MPTDIDAEDGWVDHVVAREFPALRLRYAIIAAGATPSPIELRNRLDDLSTRFRARKAMELPTKPIPSAYRVFLRQVGLDPESRLSPIEAVTRDRILRGTYHSTHRLADALTVATVESQIAISVLDADLIDLPLGIRTVREDDATELPAGTLVIADANGPAAELFGEAEPHCIVGANTTRTTVMAIGVEGVADWMLDDALWRVAEIAVPK
jgi:DNA/RNA-binding domain of Phe-tRNA-synthetase-like protein